MVVLETATTPVLNTGTTTLKGSKEYWHDTISEPSL
jgi:hypothetical protein